MAIERKASDEYPDMYPSLQTDQHTRAFSAVSLQGLSLAEHRDGGPCIKTYTLPKCSKLRGPLKNHRKIKKREPEHCCSLVLLLLPPGRSSCFRDQTAWCYCCCPPADLRFFVFLSPNSLVLLLLPPDRSSCFRDITGWCYRGCPLADLRVFVTKQPGATAVALLPIFVFS